MIEAFGFIVTQMKKDEAQSGTERKGVKPQIHRFENDGRNNEFPFYL